MDIFRTAALWALLSAAAPACGPSPRGGAPDGGPDIVQDTLFLLDDLQAPDTAPSSDMSPDTPDAPGDLASCAPDCDEMDCGWDGCGGWCGACAPGSYCMDGVCLATPCAPNCGALLCGGDGCGGLCGSCDPEEFCDLGLCVPGSCAPDCEDMACGDDGCGGTCGESGPYLTCSQETWDCGPPCAEELFSAEVCGSGEDVQSSCGACTSDGAGILCIREEEDAQGVVQTWCECWGEEEGFHCTWKRPIPGQTHCQKNSDCPEGFCAGACHPHAPPYCTTNCTSHADCPEGTYCGFNVAANFWEEIDDDWYPQTSPRCVPDGYLSCETSCDPDFPFYDGCPCENDEDCGPGTWYICIPSRHGRMCSVSGCMPECLQNLSCAQIYTEEFDVAFSCVDRYLLEGMPCQSNDVCRYPWQPPGSGPAGYCVLQGNDGAFCVDWTNSGWGPNVFLPAVCLAGGDCAELKSGSIPADFLECPWYHIEVEAATDCAVSNEHGICLGERRCTAAGLTDCDAQIPAGEICDGVDNDCDGETDEGC